MADCCEPGCSAEVLCPVHQVLADLRAKADECSTVGEVIALIDGMQS